MATKSLKAVRNFVGRDTYARRVEIAQAENGQWFGRHQRDGRYQGMTAWYAIEAPDFQEYGTNAYTGERFRREQPACFWGWNKMDELDGPHNLRLPKTEAA